MGGFQISDQPEKGKTIEGGPCIRYANGRLKPERARVTKRSIKPTGNRAANLRKRRAFLSKYSSFLFEMAYPQAVHEADVLLRRELEHAQPVLVPGHVRAVSAPALAVSTSGRDPAPGGALRAAALLGIKPLS